MKINNIHSHEKNWNNQNKKMTKRKSVLLLFAIIFLVGNISFYLKERAKWIYDGQPYPKAKEWLVPANIMLVYGTTLTKLPFIDERSLIMKPIIGLQDYFVSKWQENLPDDDAEKYLGWYIFRLRTYLVPNAKSIILYNNDTYSYSETKEANEKAWKTIEAMIKYKAKDKEFNEIRYSAFLNLAYLYLDNASVYWVYEKKPDIEIYNMSQEKNYYFDIKKMYADRTKMRRFYELFDAFKSMQSEYQQYPDILQRLSNKFYINYRNYNITNFILYDLIHKKNESICSKNNKYSEVHIKAKNNLLRIYSGENKLGKQSIDKLLSNSVDNKLKQFCDK